MKEKDKTTYRAYAEARAASSPLIKDMFFAFLVGGAICTVGQGLNDLFLSITENEEYAGTCACIVLIFSAALLTGLGWFDRIARFAGAGTLVPITGFANAMTSPAIDAKSEGWVLGVGAKIFSVTGPVILYGVLSSALYGTILFTVNAVMG